MPEMRLAGDRYKYPVSDAELDRRLNAVQDAICSAQLDGLILHTTSVAFDSVIRYLIDRPTHNYGNTLIIPASGAMTYIDHAYDNDNAPIPDSIRNVGRYMTKAFCQQFYCSDGVVGSCVINELKSRGWKRVGIAYMQLVTADLYSALRAELPELELVDFSAQFSRIKAIKSPEEWELISRSLRAHEHLIAAVPSLLRPGRMEYEVLADLEQASRYLGCDCIGNISVGSAKSGGNALYRRNFYANRRLERGDTVNVLVEVSGPGGLYGEAARVFCLGEPSKNLLDLYDTALECQRAVAAAAKPGATGRDLNTVFDAFVTSRGMPKNGRFAGHGQGYDMMESPAICDREDMPLEENMYLAIHPELVRNGEMVPACDNFRVGCNGAELLSRIEQKVFVLEY